MTRKMSQVLSTLGGSIVSVVLIVLFFIFAFGQKEEVIELQAVITHAKLGWLTLGVALVLAYIFFHAKVYQLCVQAIHKNLPIVYSVELFLKRYFVSAFIPTGFSVSQFTFSKELSRHKITPLESHFVSVLYLMISSVAYMMLLVPVVLALILTGELTQSELVASSLLIGVNLILLAQAALLFRKKGFAYPIVTRFFPDLPKLLDSWSDRSIHRSRIGTALVISLLVELTGIMLLWVVLQALQIDVSIFVAGVGYAITILVLTFSPLFQGVGLVELSLAYGLTQFGLVHSQAVAATLLFRLFQLWIPFGLGLGLYVRRRTKKIMADLPI